MFAFHSQLNMKDGDEIDAMTHSHGGGNGSQTMNSISNACGDNKLSLLTDINEGLFIDQRFLFKGPRL